MDRLRAYASKLGTLLEHFAAFFIKPLLELIGMLPQGRTALWEKALQRFEPYRVLSWKVALPVFVIAIILLNPPLAGWRSWLEWKTFTGAKPDEVNTGTQKSKSAYQNSARIYGAEGAGLRSKNRDGKPQQISINFYTSVAPLSSVGQKADDIEISPEIKGQWRWAAPNKLDFQPEEEWPIDESFTVRLGPKALAEHIKLSTNTYSFRTARFDLSVTSSSFYQDPVQVNLRKAVFDVEFTHPVEPESFEKRLSMEAASASHNVNVADNDNLQKFTVTYDTDRMHASVQSAPLHIPEIASTLTLVIRSGTKPEQNGNSVEHDVRQSVEIPGLYNLNITELRHIIVTGENGEPESVLQIITDMAVNQSEMGRGVTAWLLPERHTPSDSDTETTIWNNPNDVTDDVLKQATPVALTPIPAEREATEAHAFKFSADPGRFMYIRIAKGLKSAGGYQLGDNRNEIVRVKQFSPELTVMSKGSLLALSGEKKLPIVVRDLPGIRFEIGRLLPQQLQHFISQSQGDMSTPSFYSGISPDNLTERFEKKIPLKLQRGKTHYESLDFSEYLRPDSSDHRGVFLLTVEGYDPNNDTASGGYQPPRNNRQNSSEDEESDGDYGDEGDGYQESSNEAPPPGSMRDTRLVIVTDLGVISKMAMDGTRDVFVQSIATGQPVSNANVEIWALNGTTLVSTATDANGVAHLPSVAGMTREKSPTVVVVRKGGDLSFLPLNKFGRSLDTSRFDVGGIHSGSLPNQIQAYLFSDRGIYRPGDTINIGIVAKSANWGQQLVDMPVEVEVIDARGLLVRREVLKLGASGMAEFSHTTQDSSPTGNYTINLNLARDAGSALPNANSIPVLRLGSTSVKVQEFMPDRMKVSATLSSESSKGWVSPNELKARVNVLNLFGTPATKRRVEASLTLTPAYPEFKEYKQYLFTDPSRTRESFSDKLERLETDDAGIAEFDLGLQRYKQATYRLHFLATAYEPEGGRSVSAEAATLVSDRPYLIGFKADGGLDYIEHNSKRNVSLIAIDPKANKIAVNKLHLVRLERKVVSVLVKQPNGLYRYESHPLESTIKDENFTIPAAGTTLLLATEAPGNFAYVVKDDSGLEISRVNYSVAGSANVSRTLDRNAELQMTLSRQDYTPGDEIEISIRAPYAGAGLITIERDKVYAHKWFKADRTASVQRITLPKDFEGNGYVSVQFTRDLASPEIYMSPMSYGIIPFATRLEKRTTPITLKVPDLIKPGQTAKFTLESGAPSRALVFAVDEGILQVARYQSPDPLKFFFQKRALEVSTQQTLDLILPEFQKLMRSSAPGGDAGAQLLGKNLNPFKRRTDKPVVYWSGVVDVNGSKQLSYTVPESFNGSLRVMAVAVNDGSVASATASTTVRGDIVLLPNVPVAMTPGDEAEIGIGVSNNAAGSGKDAPVTLSLNVSPGLEIVGPATQTLKISERTEGTTKFRVRAKSGNKSTLGSASLTFSAEVKSSKVQLTTDVSIRPASAYVTLVQTGIFRGDALLESQAPMFPNFKQSEAALSGSPWAFAAGLIRYLDVYPHGCTEQITSQTFPAVILSTQPGIAEQLLKYEQLPNKTGVKPDANLTFTRYLTQVRARQSGDGGISMWPGGHSDLFATTYVVSLLLEAKERKFAVPNDMLQRANTYLQMRLAEVMDQDYNWRVQAQAAYLLTRQGVVVTAALNNLREGLLRNSVSSAQAIQRDHLRADLGAVYLAASYKILKQEKIASELLQPALRDLATNTNPWNNWYWYYYYDPLIYRATTMQLIALHFPEQISQIPMDFWTRMASAIKDNYYQSLSAARILMATDAYAKAAVQSAAGKVGLTAIDQTGTRKEIELPQKLILTSLAVPPTTARLKLSNGGDLPLFYSWSESGYEMNLPDSAITKGIEIVHDFLDAKGSVISEAKVGDELTVRVRVRATDQSTVQQVALVDVLPGGMEPVLTAPSDDDDPSVPIWRRRLGGSSTWEIEYADIREDRVVFYGDVNSHMTEVTYKVRATNVGEFVVPAAYGEAMYERRVFGRSAAGHFKISPAD